MLAIHVRDCMTWITCGSELVVKHDGDGSLYNKFTAALKQRWRVEDEEPVTDLLNIEIKREGDAITLTQTSYITKLCREYFPDGPPAHIRMLPRCRIRWTSVSPSLKPPQMAPLPPTPRSQRSTSNFLVRFYTARRRRERMWHIPNLHAVPRDVTANRRAYGRRAPRTRVPQQTQPNRPSLPTQQPTTPRGLLRRRLEHWTVQRSQSGFVFTLGRASISWGSNVNP